MTTKNKIHIFSIITSIDAVNQKPTPREDYKDQGLYKSGTSNNMSRTLGSLIVSHSSLPGIFWDLNHLVLLLLLSSYHYGLDITELPRIAR